MRMETSQKITRRRQLLSYNSVQCTIYDMSWRQTLLLACEQKLRALRSCFHTTVYSRVQLFMSWQTPNSTVINRSDAREVGAKAFSGFLRSFFEVFLTVAFQNMSFVRRNLETKTCLLTTVTGHPEMSCRLQSNDC